MSTGLIVAAGVCAALHVAKLPPAIVALQQSLGVTLVQAGFLLSLVQLAGMSLAVAIGAWADGWGARRSMIGGLLLLGGASVIGGWADSVAILMLLRALEGMGFLLVVLPAPGWLRNSAPPGRLQGVLSLWSAYMPLATTLALLVGPWATATFGWRPWWWALGGSSLAMAAALAAGTRAPQAAAPPQRLWNRLKTTLTAPGPWLVAAIFGFYAFQWLAVIGFLPTIYRQAGFSAGATGLLTALVAAVNVVGNLGAGWWLRRGAAPWALIAISFAVMALTGLLLFADLGPVAVRYGAAVAFSAVGGLIPSTLFGLAVRVAPDAASTSTTVGWMQQGTATGQFLGPPAVAALASATGGWGSSGLATAAAAVLGMLLLPALKRLLVGDPRPV